MWHLMSSAELADMEVRLAFLAMSKFSVLGVKRIWQEQFFMEGEHPAKSI